MEPIRVKTDINEQEYRSVVYFNILQRKKWFPIIVVIGLLASLIQVVRFAAFQAIPFSDALPSIMMLILIAGILGFTELSVRRFVSAGGLEASHQEMILDENGIGLVLSDEEDSVSVQEWKNFSGVVEMKALFLLFFNSRQVVILSKRAFTEDQMQAARNLFQEKFGKKFENRVKNSR